MPPPPPPPPAPPPLKKLPISGFGTPGKANHADPPADRNALLSQIRKGTRLKKAETNDKSAPLIDGVKRTTPISSGGRRPSDSNKSNGPFPVIPPGGLFAQGIPKLRPTTPRAGDNSGPSSLTIQSIKGGSHNTSSSLDHLRIGQLSGSRSQPPSPVSKPRMSPTNRTDATESSGNPNFPDDLNIKGPAPAPPPASQKPNFNRTSDNERPAATVKRSASQTNISQRPRVNRPPPNVKPPPPPKNNVVAPPTAPPPPPSKPPNILRRQSFGVGEASRFTSNTNKLSNGTQKQPGAGVKNVGLAPPPPPPPRNNSVPNELNQIGSSSPNQWSKMNIAPPPPPNRAGVGVTRAAPIRPAPPRAPAPPPPPPPQHSNHPAPPSQMKAMLSATNAPPPPTRVSSMKQSSDFEERFKFHSAQTLPKPDRFPNTQKSYPSKVNHSRGKQNTRRLPPPPPPQPGGQSVLHIQLNSGIFSNNFAHS